MADNWWDSLLEKLEPFKSEQPDGATEYFPDVQKRRGMEADLNAALRGHHSNLGVVNEIASILITDSVRRRLDVNEMQDEILELKEEKDRHQKCFYLLLGVHLLELLLFVFFLLH